MRSNFLKLFFISIILISFGCNGNQVQKKQDTNSNNLLNATAWFQQSAEMRACYTQTFNWAKKVLKANIDSSKSKLPKAVVVDIDETMLDNSPYEVYLIKNNLTHKKDLWNHWVSLAVAEPLPGALDFAKFAEANNVEVFYISNRSVKNLAPTMKNLIDKGFPFADSTHILLKDSTSDKSPRRELVASKHDVVLLVGDNLRDFDEIFKDRTNNFGFKTVDANKKLFGTKYFILPNPMYGQWMTIYNIPNKKISLKQKIENMIQILKGE